MSGKPDASLRPVAGIDGPRRQQRQARPIAAAYGIISLICADSITALTSALVRFTASAVAATSTVSAVPPPPAGVDRPRLRVLQVAYRRQ